MATAEVKPKRIKHLYPRKELYHRFIHSEEYAYSPNTRKQVSCHGNYLVLGDIGRKATIQDVEDMWYYNQRRMIAIIDRNLKRILISNSFSDYAQELKRAIPDNYTVYNTDGAIPNKDILKDKYACNKLHAEFLITRFVGTCLLNHYSVLYNNAKTIHNIDYKNLWYYKEIEAFVKDNNLKKSDIYKECFSKEHKIKFYKNSWNPITINVKLPTLKQILTDTIFTKKEKLLLEQRCFWTLYCYNEGIPFKHVVDNWNKPITKEEAQKYLDKENIYVTEDVLDNIKTWTDCISKVIGTTRKIYNIRLIDAENTERKNFEKAKEELLKTIDTKFTVGDWREGRTTSITDCQIKYRGYILKGRGRYKRIEWIYKTFSLPRTDIFKNIQLKLNGNSVITTRHASVPLHAAIKMYKLFNTLTTRHPDAAYFNDNYFGKVNVGVYNLRFIIYKNKVTNDNKVLDYKDWLIQIGCHSIWLEEVMDFIKYYHLEDKFGIKKKQLN